jgi:hypothetical protein
MSSIGSSYDILNWRPSENCPIAPRLKLTRGPVTDIFLPRWFAKRIFSVCGTMFTISCIILAVRSLRH